MDVLVACVLLGLPRPYEADLLDDRLAPHEMDRGQAELRAPIDVHRGRGSRAHICDEREWLLAPLTAARASIEMI